MAKAANTSLLPVPLRSKRSISATAVSEFQATKWNTEDLCPQCRAIDLRTIRTGSVRIEQGSTCPLCLFFASIALARDVKAVADTAVKLRFVLDPFYPRGKISRQYPACISVSGLRFIHPLNDDDGIFGQLVRFRPLEKNYINTDLLKEWITFCEDHHSFCSSPSTENLRWHPENSNVKVIDCTTRKIIPAPPDLRYVALSYVWGGPPTQENPIIESCEDSLDLLPEPLPNTIEDAIKVTTQLGFRYLWVDKYCINQSVVRELQHQLSIMDKIYNWASLTIVAAAGDNSSFGLPGVGSRPRITHSVNINGTTWVSGSLNFKDAVQESPWSKRGWTYQEAYFSRRSLMFTEEQVVFECGGGSCCEFLDIDLRNMSSYHHGLIHGGMSHKVPRMNLSEHLIAYTGRELTNSSDALNAMRGLLRSFASSTKPVYQYWGIPINPEAFSVEREVPYCKNQTYLALGHGLAWYTYTNQATTRGSEFPSWSWAGWNSPVAWSVDLSDDDDNAPSCFYVEKNNGTTEVLTEELIASISLEQEYEMSGYTKFLRIEALVLEVKFSYFREGTSKVFSYMNYAITSTMSSRTEPQPEHDTKYWELFLTPKVDEQDELYIALRDHRVFSCIILNSKYGLVVWMQNGVYERVGLLKMAPHRQTSSAYPQPGTLDDLKHHFPSTRREIRIG
ncbi:HET-domain-containing protein [Dothidotthia symphoricarpi CBS 119687]|uniref:HET-domain-containing protein n=1 Tax=Dothidotthia symphoricarpi CBS 119687 TaxID=1392245 RepID=A0A6A6AG98_9PLEO|nr:HET-domain-containing protein [Dothidotthia symphoricarpi CBS 119687]KAF2130145.1 HET-domain-containing protein [Dothidotthia symphoricarpi CBS 119687]